MRMLVSMQGLGERGSQNRQAHLPAQWPGSMRQARRPARRARRSRVGNAARREAAPRAASAGRWAAPLHNAKSGITSLDCHWPWSLCAATCLQSQPHS
jgi:hypothetical protein